VLEPFVRVGDHQLDPAQATPEQGLQERRPERLGFRRAEAQAHNLPLTLGVHGNRDYRRHGDDPTALPDLQVGGIEPEIRPPALQRALQKAVHPFIDVLAELGDRALADPAQTHRLHQVVDAPGRYPADPGLPAGVS
jgi:hypothetical protein